MTIIIKTKGCNFTNSRYCICLGCYYECEGQLQHMNGAPCCSWNTKEELKYYFYHHYIWQEIARIYPMKTKKDYLKSHRKILMDRIRKYKRIIYI